MMRGIPVSSTRNREISDIVLCKSLNAGEKFYSHNDISNWKYLSNTDSYR